MPKPPSDTLQPDTPRVRARNEFIKTFFLQHLEDTRGIISVAAARAGISRQTVYAWRAEDPEFAEAVREIREEFSIDWAESKLAELIDGVAVFTRDGVVYERPPDANALRMYLSARGKKRGYGQEGRVALNSPESESSATGRAGVITMDHVFKADDGLVISASEFLSAMESECTVEELNTINDVCIRVRTKILASRGLQGGDPSGSGSIS